MSSSTLYELHPSAGLGHELTVLLNPEVLGRKTAADNATTPFPIQCQLLSKYTWFVGYSTREENPRFSKTYLFLISKTLSFTYENLCPSPLGHSPR